MQENSVSIDEKWPVIIHSSLQNTDLFTQLKDIHKVRGIYISLRLYRRICFVLGQI